MSMYLNGRACDGSDGSRSDGMGKDGWHCAVPLGVAPGRGATAGSCSAVVTEGAVKASVKGFDTGVASAASSRWW